MMAGVFANFDTKAYTVPIVRPLFLFSAAAALSTSEFACAVVDNDINVESTPLKYFFLT